MIEAENEGRPYPKMLVPEKTKALTSTNHTTCLLYTSDAADERSSVDLGGRRIIKKKTTEYIGGQGSYDIKSK